MGEFIGQQAPVHTGSKYLDQEVKTSVLRVRSRESTNVRKGGTSFPVRSTSEPILDRDGSPEWR